MQDEYDTLPAHGDLTVLQTDVQLAITRMREMLKVLWGPKGEGIMSDSA